MRPRRIARWSAGGAAMVATALAVVILGGGLNRLWPVTRCPANAEPRARRPAGRPSDRRAELAQAIAEDAPLPVDAGLEAPDPIGEAPMVNEAPRVLQGPMEAVLYPPPHPARRADAALAAEALHLFAYKLDLTRDLALGQRVRLVGAGERLDYAEVDEAGRAVRLYRIAPPGQGAGAFVDEAGLSLRRLLLRTPIAHPRPTSGFGLRLHPLLGYSRMHQGVDFGAPVGTPVAAAGDGAVEAARWAGGYGWWVRLRHAGGYETAYAHLSSFAAAVRPGAAVAQGQVIGWSGASGLATGPHLHFELWKDGRPIDPSAAGPLAASASAEQRTAFNAARRRIHALLQAAGPAPLATPPGG